MSRSSLVLSDADKTRTLDFVFPSHCVRKWDRTHAVFSVSLAFLHTRKPLMFPGQDRTADNFV